MCTGHPCFCSLISGSVPNKGCCENSVNISERQDPNWGYIFLDFTKVSANLDPASRLPTVWDSLTSEDNRGPGLFHLYRNPNVTKSRPYQPEVTRIRQAVLKTVQYEALGVTEVDFVLHLETLQPSWGKMINMKQWESVTGQKVIQRCVVRHRPAYWSGPKGGQNFLICVALDSFPKLGNTPSIFLGSWEADIGQVLVESFIFACAERCSEKIITSPNFPNTSSKAEFWTQASQLQIQWEAHPASQSKWDLNWASEDWVKSEQMWGSESALNGANTTRRRHEARKRIVSRQRAVDEVGLDGNMGLWEPGKGVSMSCRFH